MSIMDPLTDFMDLSRALSKRLEEDFRWGSATMNQMPVDMYETAEDVYVQAYLPGFRHDHVRTELNHNRLSIKAERSLPQAGEYTWLHVESPYGVVYRSISIGPAIDAEKIEATWREGVLTVRLPKVEQARPKSIPIRIEGDDHLALEQGA